MVWHYKVKRDAGSCGHRKPLEEMRSGRKKEKERRTRLVAPAGTVGKFKVLQSIADWTLGPLEDPKRGAGGTDGDTPNNLNPPTGT